MDIFRHIGGYRALEDAVEAVWMAVTDILQMWRVLKVRMDHEEIYSIFCDICK